MNDGIFTRNDYFRKRARSVGLSLVVMGVSFFLYYLGLFGNVEGPLAPENLGSALAGMGVTKVHMLMFFLSFFIIAMTWNHLFNLISFVVAARLTCTKQNNDKSPCAAATRKIKTQLGNGKTLVWFECVNGHKCDGAKFHPVKKGVISHTVWVAALLFCVIIFYGS